MERLKLLQEMHAHSQFCLSGDHTLEATQAAIAKVGRTTPFVPFISSIVNCYYFVPSSFLGIFIPQHFL
jgi:hypothetical protein